MYSRWKGQSAQLARAPEPPRKPSHDEARRHELTHLPDAPWCEACVLGRGREASHRRRAVPDPDHIEEFQMDHFCANPRSEENCGELQHLAVHAPRYGHGAPTTS